MRSDIQHRSDAVIDQLTGMLNRKALGVRALELAQQSEVTGEPVGVIVADLDHFKHVNDTRGHTVGDAVLKEVAYLLRKQLRAFDLAYRLGGEEFLILVPGSDIDHAAELAERLREAVRAEQRRRRREGHDELRRGRARRGASASTTRRCSRAPTPRCIRPSAAAATACACADAPALLGPSAWRRARSRGRAQSSITLRMPSWASISSKPRLTSSSGMRCEMNGSTSISPSR